MATRHARLDRAFPRDATDGRTEIRLRVASYDDLFDPLDAGPDDLRRVSQDVEDYLEGALDLLPDKEPLRIAVMMPADALDTGREPGVTSALRAGFELRRAGLAEELDRNRRRIMGLLLVGLVPLIAGHLIPLLLGHHRSDGPVFGDFEWLIDNVLVIASWVFVWEAVSAFAFGRRELASRDRRLDRLEQAPVTYRPADGPRPGGDRLPCPRPSP